MNAPHWIKNLEVKFSPKEPANDAIDGVQHYSPQLAMTYVNDRCAWIEDLGQIVRTDGERLSFWKKEAFTTTFSNRKVTWRNGEQPVVAKMGNFWLSHRDRRSYACVGLWAPPRRPPPRALNLWRGFAVEPKAGDWSVMQEHLLKVIAGGDENLAAYLVKWMAWLFQNPGIPAEVAVALRGKQGTGKGLFGNALKRIFGRHAVHVTSPKDFASGRFNAHLADCVFLFADECHWPGHKEHEGTLKGMLTEPTIRVEPKGVDSYEVDNALHVLISSNDQWLVPAGIDDRRFVVADVSDARKGDHAYFKELVREMDGDGLGAMLHDLLALPLGDWHPRQIVDTAARREQKERSLGPEEEWLLALLEEGVLPAPTTPFQDRPPAGVAYSTDLEEDARRRVPALRHRSIRSLGAALRSIGCTRWRSADRRHRGWQFLPLADARKAWTRSRWARDEWPDVDDWG